MKKFGKNKKIIIYILIFIVFLVIFLFFNKRNDYENMDSNKPLMRQSSTLIPNANISMPTIELSFFNPNLSNYTKISAPIGKFYYDDKGDSFSINNLHFTNNHVLRIEGRNGYYDDKINGIIRISDAATKDGKYFSKDKNPYEFHFIKLIQTDIFIYSTFNHMKKNKMMGGNIITGLKAYKNNIQKNITNLVNEITNVPTNSPKGKGKVNLTENEKNYLLYGYRLVIENFNIQIINTNFTELDKNFVDTYNSKI